MDMVGVPGSAGVGDGPFDDGVERDGLIDSVRVEALSVDGEVGCLGVPDHRPVHVADGIDELSSFGNLRSENGGELGRCRQSCGESHGLLRAVDHHSGKNLFGSRRASTVLEAFLQNSIGAGVIKLEQDVGSVGRGQTDLRQGLDLVERDAVE